MKVFLFLIASLGFCANEAWAMGSMRCYEQAGSGTVICCRNGYCSFRPPPDNTAYFNVKASPKSRQEVSATSRSAAINLTETDILGLIKPNMTWTIRNADYATTLASFNIGTASSTIPQTWVLPANFTNLFTQTTKTDFIPPSSVTPIEAQEPDATHVSKTTYLSDDGLPVTEYNHYELDAGQSLNDLGSTFVHEGIVYDYGEAAELFADVPLDLNDEFDSYMTEYIDEDPYPKFDKVATVTVDGFGTITNPFVSGATYNCLRMTITSTEKFYENAITAPTTKIRYYVSWVTKEGFRLIAEKPSAATSGIMNLKNLEMHSFAPSAVLAVELLDFQGVAANKSVDLTWTTTSEKDNDYYQIERSKDGKTFEKIGQVKGNGTTNVKQAYSFRDESPLWGLGANYYRLRQIDFDGTSTTSNIISVTPSENKEKLQVYPNPAQNTLTIAFNQGVGNTSNVANFKIINVLGQEILRGTVNQSVDISALPMGSYVVKVGLEQTTFVKQ
jgi:hypothetical protein